jgi:Flp pilus assembly protein TadD
VKPIPIKKPTKKPTKIQETKISPTEPPEGLSPKSRELLNKSSQLMSPKKATPSKPLKIDHAHDMQDLFKADEFPIDGGRNDSLGIKVENERQKLNLDYELEKAYNAINSGQSESAIDTYKVILNNSPDNAQALFGLATMYHRARQFDKARPLYAKLLTVDPQHRDGFNNFLVLLADEAPHEALVELEKLEEKNPGFSTIPAQLAIIYQKTGEPDKAIDKMFRAVSLAPENLTYRYNLAIMLDKQKNYDEAAKLYRQLVEASARGEKSSVNIEKIQQRLTFISSNR